MKRTLKTLAAMAGIALLLHACSTGKNSVTNPRNNNDDQKIDANTACYIQLNDGTVKKFRSLKLVTGVMVTPHLLADGKVKIYAGEIKSYLNNEHFAVSQSALTNPRNSCVAVETLPGFAVRIIKGKLNVYRKKFYNGQHAVDEYYVQSGDDGQIIPYSAKVMVDLLKDNPEASKFFNNKKNKGNSSKLLITAVQLFNNDQLMSKN
ncbi:MAG: hypothetical protein ABJA78_03330 [Ferruginibacter sp.]